MKTFFSKADHLLCWLHAKDNVQKKLIDLNIKNGSYINELFGKK